MKNCLVFVWQTCVCVTDNHIFHFKRFTKDDPSFVNIQGTKYTQLFESNRYIRVYIQIFFLNEFHCKKNGLSTLHTFIARHDLMFLLRF